MHSGFEPVSASSARSALTAKAIPTVRAASVRSLSVPSAPSERHPSDARQYGDHRTAMRYVPPSETWRRRRASVSETIRGAPGPVTIGTGEGTA